MAQEYWDSFDCQIQCEEIYDDRNIPDPDTEELYGQDGFLSLAERLDDFACYHDYDDYVDDDESKDYRIEQIAIDLQSGNIVTYKTYLELMLENMEAEKEINQAKSLLQELTSIIC